MNFGEYHVLPKTTCIRATYSFAIIKIKCVKINQLQWRLFFFVCVWNIVYKCRVNSQDLSTVSTRMMNHIIQAIT